MHLLAMEICCSFSDGLPEFPVIAICFPFGGDVFLPFWLLRHLWIYSVVCFYVFTETAWLFMIVWFLMMKASMLDLFTWISTQMLVLLSSQVIFKMFKDSGDDILKCLSGSFGMLSGFLMHTGVLGSPLLYTLTFSCLFGYDDHERLFRDTQKLFQHI